jgi:hypothetical protein
MHTLLADLVRSGRVLLAGAALLLSGCLMFFEDNRPWFVNSTREVLEVQSTHADGHTLKIMLYPGSRVPLGAAEDAVKEIAVRRLREPAIVVPESEIRSCLEDASRDCLGWEMGSGGLAAIASHPPAAPAGDGLGRDSDLPGSGLPHDPAYLAPQD